jgi:phosphodiesterase/alkaline phosphatase D-like protein
MKCAYILGTFNDIPKTDESNFILLGTFRTKEEAKQAVSNMASAVVKHDLYKNGVTIYELKHENNKIRTFVKKDFEHIYTENRKKQLQDLESQDKQLQQQRTQIQKQIDELKD